jgi:hypothetical protein
MEFLKRKKIIILKSKGGRIREIDYADRPEKFERVGELTKALKEHLKTSSWKSVREGYYKDFRQAVLRSGEVYTGSHAFKVNYVKERLKEFKSQGYSDLTKYLEKVANRQYKFKIYLCRRGTKIWMMKGRFF